MTEVLNKVALEIKERELVLYFELCYTWTDVTKRMVFNCYYFKLLPQIEPSLRFGCDDYTAVTRML